MARISEPALFTSSRKKPSLPFAPRKVMSLAPTRTASSSIRIQMESCFMYSCFLSVTTPVAVMNCSTSAPCILVLLEPMLLFQRVFEMVPATTSANSTGPTNAVSEPLPPFGMSLLQ